MEIRFYSCFSKFYQCTNWTHKSLLEISYWEAELVNATSFCKYVIIKIKFYNNRVVLNNNLQIFWMYIFTPNRASYIFYELCQVCKILEPARHWVWLENSESGWKWPWTMPQEPNLFWSRACILDDSCTGNTYIRQRFHNYPIDSRLRLLSISVPRPRSKITAHRKRLFRLLLRANYEK